MGQGRLTTLIISATVFLNISCLKQESPQSEVEKALLLKMVPASVLHQLASRQIILKVPSACLEGENPTECQSWLGMRDDKIGLTHSASRTAYSIEDVTPDGRFHLAVYPDCTLDARVAAEQAASMPEARPEADTVEGADTPEQDSGPELVVVTPPADNDPSMVAPSVLTASPLAACKRFVAPSATLGEAVQLLTPENVGEKGWWQIHFPKGGVPRFVSSNPCSGDNCRIRLQLTTEGLLVSTTTTVEALGLHSFLDKITGSVSQGFSAIEGGVSDAKKAIGSTPNVSSLGNNKLYVEAALPAARLYSAVKEQGASALSYADGTINDGIVYVKVGAQYIGEYIQANACYLGVGTALAYEVWQPALNYEISLAAAANTIGKSDALTAFVIMAAKDSPQYQAAKIAALALAPLVSLISRRYSISDWENIIMYTLAEALAGHVKTGFTVILMSKLATAICKGTTEGLSPSAVLQSVISTNGISTDCLEGIKSRSIARFEASEDMCYSLNSEIAAAAAAVPPNNSVIQAWDSGEASGACPRDPADSAYQSLLESMGCQKPKVSVSSNASVDELAIDDSTVLTNDRYWGRTTNWNAGVACASGSVAVGMCSSGKNQDCYGQAKEILCAKRSDIATVYDGDIVDLRKDFSQDSALCPENYVVSEFCSSGANRDCAGTNLVVRCRRINSTYAIDYNNCTLKESKAWDPRLQATAPNQVMVGMCTSGKYPDCGKNRDVTKSATFCPLNPAAGSPSPSTTHNLYEYFNNGEQLPTVNITENPPGWILNGSHFRLYNEGGADRVPFMRCSGSGGHFASNDPNCEGQTVEGLMGYLSSTTGTPVYRCSGRYHLTTTDRSACDTSGYRFEGSMGFAP